MSASPSVRVAYVASLYPAASHTFIRREVAALRALGLGVSTFSIRAPALGERTHPLDEEAFRTTSYLLPMGPFRLLSGHAWALFRHPLRYFGVLLAALKHRAPGLRALLWSLFHFTEAIVLARECNKANVSHIHSHFANAGGTLGYLASRLLGVKWSVTLHGDMDFDYPSRLMLADKAKQADFVACVSYFGRAQAMRILDSRLWEKLTIVRCGVDTAAFTRRGRRVGGRPRIVSVGRLSPEKGQLGLIEAFGRLVKRGIDAELRVVGDGPLRARIEREIQERGLASHCVLLGRMTESEVAEELAHADVFALSSFLEGLPVVLMEALAMELGVVAPCVAGIPELVVHETSGLLFAPSRWDELEAQLERLLADAALCDRLGREGRRRVEVEFDSRIVVRPLAERWLGSRQ